MNLSTRKVSPNLPVETSDLPFTRDIDAVSQIEIVPVLLDVLCDLTGMRFAAVARVTETAWVACAVKDEIGFGLPVGGQLPVESTLCFESMHANAAIVINHASTDPRYAQHHTPRIYNIESYVSVPIVLSGGRYFGNLCAIDPAPAEVNNQKIINTFSRFASIIAHSLESQERSDRDAATISSERATAELREQFIAILGHDLRNPLQAVYATSELMQRKALEPAQVRELAARIQDNAKRMSALINDVLDFARGKLGGGIGLQLEDVDDVNAGLHAVVNEIQDAHSEREIVADIGVTRRFRCDLGRLQQVASNLIGNAIMHGSNGHPVEVTAGTDGDEFVLAVRNYGEPIPAQSLSKIFEPFWRSSTSATRHGLGLGLHICSQIVRAHKGHLSVTSTASGGTTFMVRIPLQ